MKRLTLILLMLLVLVPASAQDDDPEDLDFFLTFVPNIQFSPLYAATPYLAEMGYNLQIQHGDENVGVDLIANDSMQFGMISGEQVLLARAGRRPVVFVYEWFQQFPVGVVVPNTTGAETVNDLQGLRVGIPGRFGASYSGLIALLAANDLTERDIQLEAIGFTAPDIVCTGNVDAAVIYVNNEPLQIESRIADDACGDIESVAVIPVAASADMVSNGIVTNERTIERDPDTVRDLVAAFDRGLSDVITNPARAYLLSLEFVDSLPITDDFRAALEDAADAQEAFLAEEPTRDEIARSRLDLLTALEAGFDAETVIQFRVLIATIDLWDAEQLGFTDPDSWALTLDVLNTMDMLVRDLDDLDAAYTNDFLPDAE